MTIISRSYSDFSVAQQHQLRTAERSVHQRLIEVVVSILAHAVDRQELTIGNPCEAAWRFKALCEAGNGPT